MFTFATGIALLMIAQWLGSRNYAVTYRWHGIVFWPGILCSFYALLAWLFSFLHMDRTRRLVLFVSVSACLIFLEVMVRLTRSECTYTEQRSGWYQSFYQQNMKDPLRVHRNYREFWMETPEYRYHRTVNSHGFADVEFEPKKEGELLIQTYGDSFTEGDGAPADSSYPALLRKMFDEKGLNHIKVQNFGMSGNDPGFYWRQLRDVGISMKPDIVVITYGSLDFTGDFFTRGGLERFHENGWSSIKGPWWEFIYANSNLFRWLLRISIGIDETSFLTTPSQREKRLQDLQSEWNVTFDSIVALAAREDCRVLLLKKPERSEVRLATYQTDFSFFNKSRERSSAVRHFDLLEHYVSYLGFTEDSVPRYYWTRDGHHNPLGYELMAKAVFYALMSQDRILSEECWRQVSTWPDNESPK